MVKSIAHVQRVPKRTVKSISARAPQQHVKSLSELFSAWPKALWETAQKKLGKRITKTLLFRKHLQVGSSFSGLGTTTIGLRAVKAGAPPSLKDTIQFEDVSAYEIARGPRQILVSSRKFQTPGGCVFGDICVHGGISEKQFMREGNLSAKMKKLAKAKRTRRSWCYRHNRYCTCKKANYEAGGSPCIAYSNIGQRQGIKHPTLRCFLSWAKKIKKDGTEAAVHENVEGFPTSLMKKAFPKKSHRVSTIMTETKHVGFQKMARRRRKYHIIHNRKRTRRVADPKHLYRLITKKLEKITTKPGAFMVATKRNVRMERDRLRKLRGPGKKFKTLLTSREKLSLKGYRAKWKARFCKDSRKDRGAYFHLGDNSLKRCVWSGADNGLPTWRKSMGIVWSDAEQRPVTGKEALVSLGFPMTRRLQKAAGMRCNFPDSFLRNGPTLHNRLLRYIAAATSAKNIF